MTPSIQHLVQEITGRPPSNHAAEPDDQQKTGVVIRDEDLQLAAAYRAMLNNEDFMTILRDNERQARFELGALDEKKAPELELRISLAKWRTEREKPVEMSKFLVFIEKALDEQKNAVENPKKDDKSFTPD
mgnify:FL=1